MKVAIIGGGACGLVLANCLEEAGIEYELFEKSICGRKILASGNGKANIANVFYNEASYNNILGYELVSKYHKRLMSFFKSIHLETKVDEEGRMYPYSESSLTVLNCLMKKKLHILENFNVQSIQKINHKYYINDVRGPFDELVFATGSIASFIPKKQADCFAYLESLNLKMKPIKPSLVGFRLKGDFRKINGVRVKCMASLYQNEHLIHQETGEIIFKIDGISGICILNLSSYYQRLKNHENCHITLNLIPNLEIKELTQDELCGLVHPKIVDYINSLNIKDYVQFLKNLSFDVVGTYDFEFAQVVSGGISLEEIDEHLALKKDPHIHVGGELLDLDGICGGYNLMLAFICGLKIGDELCSIK